MVIKRRQLINLLETYAIYKREIICLSILMILKLLWNAQILWMIADILKKKNLNPIVTDLYIWGKKLNISLVFITQSYFAVPKNIRLNSTHYFMLIMQNKWEFQQIAFNFSSDINFKDFVNLSKNVPQNHILF